MTFTHTAKDTYELQNTADAQIAQAKIENDADAAIRAEEQLLRAQQEIGGTVYKVPVERVSELQEKIEKISRKADKLETRPVTMLVTNETVTEEKRGLSGIRFPQDYRFVIVSGTTPVIEGWEFLAIVQHDRLGNKLHRMPSWARNSTEEIDLTRFEFTGRICEHCNKNRIRNATYLVHNRETGETRQVGSTCLGDFTGFNNPQQAAAACEGIFNFHRDILQIQREVPRTAKTFFLRDWLAFVNREVRLNGWVSGKKAFDQGGLSSAQATKKHLLTVVEQGSTDENDKPSAGDYEQADALINWVKEVVPEEMDAGDYKTNLMVAFGDTVTESDMGITASVIGAYSRWLADQAKRQRATASEYYGQEGDRFEGLRLKIVRKNSFDGAYGFTTAYTMEDAQGHIFNWFASKEHDLEVGAEHTFKGSIKRHKIDNYTGNKVTQITRCRIV